MLPNPPANVGVFWYFLLMPLTLYGVTAGHPEAIAFGLLAWLGQLVQQTLFGLYFLIQPGTPAGASARITDIASGGPHASPPSKDVYSG